MMIGGGKGDEGTKGRVVFVELWVEEVGDDAE